ncbi:hypothetical protein DM01DRAFT_1333905 [Hesseltinella vesiculosa]|uniref:BZIP domain-containing protein n=1 Tax=Hesseltinella vesiculosa TaxID=101127 RepID=A0A1X2GP95_9FUNG|nr:hypothetical protein DM01DRAFT_1333905 [Hesseltinella vesiculosa]
MNNTLFMTTPGSVDMPSTDLLVNFMLQQSQASSNSSTPLATPVDEWLADAQLLPMMPEFMKQAPQPQVDDLFEAYLSSPELMMATSTPMLMDGSASSVSSASPVSPAVAMPTSPTLIKSEPADVALFPDIGQANKKKALAPGYRPIAPAKKALVPIMPKSAAAAAVASPTPLAFPIMPTLSMIPRPSGGAKRKHFGKEPEEVVLKRQKNTDAARRSRLKKLLKMEGLEGRVLELEADNAKLSTKIAVLESQKSVLESKDKGLEERIRTLEAQLAEAHKALTGCQ